MSKVLDQSKIELSNSMITGFGTKIFMKIGGASKTPKMTWIEHMKNPRMVHPPKKLASRKIQV